MTPFDRDVHSVVENMADLNTQLVDGAITAEEGVGTALDEKRDIAFDKSVVASVAEFDAVWDSLIADYLGAGGQAIIDERTEKWEQYFGSSDMLP